MINHTCRCGKEYSVGNNMNGIEVECQCGNEFVFTEVFNNNESIVWVKETPKRTWAEYAALGLICIAVAVFINMIASFPDGSYNSAPSAYNTKSDKYDGMDPAMAELVENRLNVNYTSLDAKSKETFKQVVIKMNNRVFGW